MSAAAGPERTNEVTLNDEDFQFLCQLVYERTGIVLGEHKRQMVYRRLMRRTRETGVGSFSEYCALLKSACENELPAFLNAITTNLTGFFREPHHFEYLAAHFLPEHQRRFAAQKRLRIWSAGCSTGEEPYTIAITLMEAMKSGIGGWDTRILATDLDSDVVATAQRGVYKMERVSGIETAVRHKWFRKGSGDNSGQVKVHPDLARLITFKQLNLLHGWPMRGPFDVIFCRNVVIYFDKPTQQELFARYYELLRPGGLLMLGHSENLGAYMRYFNSRGRTIFQKPDTETA